MPEKSSVDLPVRWNLSVRPDGTGKLEFAGELDAESTPVAWRSLESELAGIKVAGFEIDVRQLVCDSAGLALLYHLSIGGMTPGAIVNLTGLSPELQHLLRSFSKEDFQALQEHEPTCSSFIEDVGAATWSWLCDLRQQIEFIGEVTVGVMMSLFRPRLMHWKEVVRVFEVAGVNALPVVSLLTFLVGMVIAFESAQPLEQLGAQVFVANLLGLVMSRELGPVMAAIMLDFRDVRGFAWRNPGSIGIGLSLADGAAPGPIRFAFRRSCRRDYQEHRLRSDCRFGELSARASNRRRASGSRRIHHALCSQQHFVDHPRRRNYCRGDLHVKKMNGAPHSLIEVRDLTIGYGDRLVLEGINFEVRRGEVFAILGVSGSGKSTLLKHLIGLYQPMRGDVLISGASIVRAEGDERLRILRKFGVLYQGGALFGSLTTVENVRLPLDEFTDLPEVAKDLIALSKLRLVGLESAATKLPADLSGGMQKRAGIARAIVMDPCLLFLDEPSAGLDPITSAGLDALIRELARGLGITFVMVTHELASIYSVADRVVVLDPKTRGIAAEGAPSWLRENANQPWVRQFLKREAA